MRPTLILGASLSLAACAHEHTACVEAPTAGHEHRHGHGHGHAEGGETPAHHHRFDDAARWAQEFENPERDAWQPPDLVVSSLSLARDAHVADIGAGTGYFAVRLARAAPEGRVWGVDVEPSMVRWLNERARREGITNLFSTLAAPDDALLPEPVDLVLVVDTWHHIEHRAAYFTALRASLRPGGRVAVVDFRADSPVGPPPQMRVAPEEVRRDMESAGYAFERSVEGLSRQYMLIFQRGR